MKLTHTLRAPFRFRTVVATGATLPTDDGSLARLGRSIVVTQLVLLALCTARAATDLHQGPLGSEGCIAVAIASTIVLSLAAKALGWATSSGPRAGRGLPVVPSWLSSRITSGSVRGT